MTNKRQAGKIFGVQLQVQRHSVNVEKQRAPDLDPEIHKGEVRWV
jgi:hypothetical protein